MKPARTIPEAVTRVQIEASDPALSAFVSANAGSGKTHVLAQRVIRLLLSGVEPGRILCITFTKAAAANMANRVFNTLRAWIALDDASLDAAMRAIGVRETGAVQRARARQLFAVALETPGGLKVQTIHAFCTHLLHLFPFEANVAARFTVLDEASETQLLDRITLEVTLEAAAEPDAALGRALGALIVARADQAVREMIGEALRQRDAVSRWIDGAGGLDAAMAELTRTLGAPPGSTLAQVEAEITDGPHLPPSAWAEAANACGGGSARDQEQCKRFRNAANAAGTDRIETYLSVFFTDKGRRAAIVTKAIAAEHPQLADRLATEADRLEPLLARRRVLIARDRTQALLTIAYEVIRRFRAEKDRRGLLDYGDLIEKASALLTDERAAWVHYKLDRGIDHVLIDEAQDTSPRQWAIVRSLVSEFFAGEGARPGGRTIFAVGDEKQSIFSFQGAEPRQFDDMWKLFERLHGDAGRAFVKVAFKHSFRSGPNVLGAVDTVFSTPEAFAGLTADPVGTAHDWLPGAAPGLVELWETEKPDDKVAQEGWDAPFDTARETSPSVKLARRIAGNVAAWRRQGRTPGEVLILVRRRGALFEAIIRALKSAEIPVAGADRLVLTEHIAAMDMMTLADALLLPEDDLALATVLRSPLIGFDDDDLYRIARERSPASLRVALRRATGAPFSDAAARLDGWAERALAQSPFAFYAGLLGAGGARRRFVERLGHEANDALDEFLNRALDYERSETPSLQGFVAWMRAAKADVKRDMEIARDEVRVMTVHGAKGLEAPIVILADTTAMPRLPSALMTLVPKTAVPDAPRPLVWAGRKAEDSDAIAVAREAAIGDSHAEYRRLLYVGMTRAIDRLVVCGVEPAIKRPAACWYDLVWNALQPASVQEPADDGQGMVWRYRKHLAEGPAAAEPAASAPAESPALPGWLTRDAASEPASLALVPSRAAEDAVAPRGRDDAEARQLARLRGTLMHRLLQSLPDVPSPNREAAARVFLEQRATGFDANAQEAMVRQVVAVLDDSRFAALFAPGSRAEAPIVGRLAGRAIPGGIIDRLVVTPDAVLIADYKTNRPAPKRLADVPASYLAQLAIYRGLLATLYPDRPVRAALLWTEVPEIMEIPPDVLGRALAEALAASGTP